MVYYDGNVALIVYLYQSSTSMSTTQQLVTYIAADAIEAVTTWRTCYHDLELGCFGQGAVYEHGRLLERHTVSSHTKLGLSVGQPAEAEKEAHGEGGLLPNGISAAVAGKHAALAVYALQVCCQLAASCSAQDCCKRVLAVEPGGQGADSSSKTVVDGGPVAAVPSQGLT